MTHGGEADARSRTGERAAIVVAEIPLPVRASTQVVQIETFQPDRPEGSARSEAAVVASTPIPTASAASSGA